VADDVTVLRPAPGKRLAFAIVSVLLLAMSVWGLFYAPVVAFAGVLIFGTAAVLGIARLVLPRAYATELGPAGFRTFDSFGRQIHAVAWDDIEHLTVFEGNGWRGIGSVAHLAWRSRTRTRRSGVQPWVRGGRNRLGEEFDGALPDPYGPHREIVERFMRHIEAAQAHEGRAPVSAPPRLETF
jgi:hypothetical protein